MRFSLFSLFSALLFTAFSVDATAQNQCSNIFLTSASSEFPYQELVQVDLLTRQQQEARQWTPEQIHAENIKTIELIKEYSSASEPFTEKGLNSSELSKVYNDLRNNPVIQQSNMGKYDQKNVSIGYCFGRAAFVHLDLLKMGVPKSHIRKVWIIGPMKAYGINWQFHVATVVYGKDGSWYAIDSMFSAPVKIEEWYAKFSAMDKSGTTRLYFTEAQKFSVSLGKYDRVQMGLNLKPEDDWYKGFFKDLLTWFQKS